MGTFSTHMMGAAIEVLRLVCEEEPEGVVVDLGRVGVAPTDVLVAGASLSPIETTKISMPRPKRLCRTPKQGHYQDRCNEIRTLILYITPHTSTIRTGTLKSGHRYYASLLTLVLSGQAP